MVGSRVLPCSIYLLYTQLLPHGRVVSQMVALRRLLSAGRLLRKLGDAGAGLVNEVGFRDQVPQSDLIC